MTDDDAEILARTAGLVASMFRAHAATYDTAAAAIRATAATERFTEAFRRSEARDIAAHPDLAELNVQMNGFYDAP